MNRKFSYILIAAAFALGGCERSVPEAPSVHAEAEHDNRESPHIALAPAQMEAAGIAVAEAGPATIRETLPLYGSIAPNAERVRDVTARFAGVIRTVNARIGDSVRAGATLATVESNESLQTYDVVAPIDGVVTARQANPAEQTADKVLFTVADLSSVWVELSVFAHDVAKVRVGQTVRVSGNDAGPSADGKIVYVAPFGRSANQSVTARVLLDNAERRWAPGLHVTAQVTLGEDQVPLAVRNEALQTLENGPVVFVHGEQGFEPRAVRVGRTDGRSSEVTDGLRAGERYAAANSFILKAELGKDSAGHDH